MKATEVTKEVIKAIESKKYTFILANISNPDSLGHTGNLNCVVSGLQTVDSCLKNIISCVEKNNCLCIITSDHGNCEQMLHGNGLSHKFHTLNRVPFFLIDRQDHDLRQKGALCDVAPTILELMEIDKPKEMTGESLIMK